MIPHMESEEYGSELREGIKKSMEEPFAPLNRRRQPNYGLREFAWLLGVLGGCVAFWVGVAKALHYLHGWFPHV